MQSDQDYIPPTLTVDAVVFQIIDRQLSVLLVERQREPFQGVRALPGGYSAKGEATTEALERITASKAGVSISTLTYSEQLYTFDSIDRDPRGHSVSIVYMSCGRNIATDSGSSKPYFAPVDTLPNLAYDHAAIIRYAHERLISKISYTNIVSAFLPKQFTLTQLQQSYEAILDRELDKRNFRKKFLSLELIHETGDTWRDGAHRPAKLYQFNSQSLEVLSRSFD